MICRQVWPSKEITRPPASESFNSARKRSGRFHSMVSWPAMSFGRLILLVRAQRLAGGEFFASAEGGDVAGDHVVGGFGVIGPGRGGARGEQEEQQEMATMAKHAATPWTR